MVEIVTKLVIGQFRHCQPKLLILVKGSFTLGDHDLILTNDAARMRQNAKNARNIMSKEFWRIGGDYPVLVYKLLFQMSNPRYMRWFFVLMLIILVLINQLPKEMSIMDEIEADFKNNLAPEVCLTDQYWWDLLPDETARHSQTKIIQGTDRIFYRIY